MTLIYLVQGILLSEPSERLDSFSLLAYMSPLAMLWLIPTTMILEPESPAIAQTLMLKSNGFLFLISLSCTLAFFANLLNFLVTKHTSALTLQVCSLPSPTHAFSPHYSIERTVWVPDSVYIASGTLLHAGCLRDQKGAAGVWVCAFGCFPLRPPFRL